MGGLAGVLRSLDFTLRQWGEAKSIMQGENRFGLYSGKFALAVA